MSLDAMTTGEAAARLHVSPRQVQRLVESGTIRTVGTVGRNLLLDSESVLALARIGIGRGRQWQPATAWAALLLLNGDDIAWFANSSRRWHLRARVAHLSAEELIRSTRSRAATRRLRASASFLDNIAAHLTRTGAAGLEHRVTADVFGLAPSRAEVLDGYVSADAAGALVERFQLVDDQHGNLVMRVVPADLGHLLEPGGVAIATVVAVDLAESLDPRERAAAVAHLSRALAGLNQLG
jgi:excisionase family DNA binding protein